MRQAIIFDLDGTLADSEPVHERALRTALESFGMELSPEQFLTLCVGYGDLPALANVGQAHGRTLSDDELRTLSAAKHAEFARLLASEGVPACDGAIELVLAAAQRVPVAVCSGSRRATVSAVLESLGLARIARAVVTLDDVTHGKPHPEPYRSSAKLLGLEPNQCVAIEDTPTGLRSALDAGMGTAAVCHSVDRASLAGAHMVVSRIEQLTVDDLLAV